MWRIIFLFICVALLQGCVLGALSWGGPVYNVSVVDQNGRPVPYATVWFLRGGKEQFFDSDGLMRRLVRRYQSENDVYAALGSNFLHEQMLFVFADADGEARVELARADFEEIPGALTLLAAVKRGYEGAVVATSSQINRNERIYIRVHSSARALQDTPLENLDRIRSQFQDSDRLSVPLYKPGIELAGLRQQAIALAAALESQGSRDAASRVYLFLSGMPDIASDDSGVPPRYTDGWAGGDQQRQTYVERAIELNETSVELKVMAAARAYREVLGKDFDPHKDFQRVVSVSRKYIDELTRIRAEYGDQFSPFNRVHLSYQYKGIGDFNGACDALRDAYVFEPEFKSKKGWDT